jgi:tetratricopeptide (TPR) repeat protein
MKLGLRFIVCLSFFSIFAWAQVEVRRALPVQELDPDTYPNPDWVERAVQEIEVRRALPASAPEPTPLTPNIVVPASALATVAPATVAPAPVAPAQLEDPSNIRIAPSTNGAPGALALERANNFYSRKMYDLAIPEYELFLISSSGSPTRDAALFRVAECHRMAGNSAAARSAYEKLLSEFKMGEFASAGAYRLGEILFVEKLFEPASIQFDMASSGGRDPEVRLSASYFAARSLDALKKDDMAEERYLAVLAATGTNPYRDNAAIALAALQLRNGKKAAALSTLGNLVETTEVSDVASSAALQAAALAKELGMQEKALRFYDRLASGSGDDKSRSEATLAALRLRYEANDTAGIIAMGEGIESKVPIDSRSEALQILAGSFRKAGKEKQAIDTYDRLAKEFPETATNPDTRYQRLLSLYATKDKSLVAEVDGFLQIAKNPKQIASAMLLKAETLFQQGDYAGAALGYAPVVHNSAFTPDQQKASLYKLAWCFASSGDNLGAIRAYTSFVEKNPQDKLAAAAVLQRGMARQKTGDFDSSLADFQLVVSGYPFSKEVELAVLQMALTYGQKKNYPEMAKAFRLLLQKFPNTVAAAQAKFWLGWAAFEEKEYKSAIEQLDSARTLDPAGYRDRATLRILLSYFQLKDRNSATREADQCKPEMIPAEIRVWLAQGMIEAKKFTKAENLLTPLAASPASMPVEGWLLLADTQRALNKMPEARTSVDKYLSLTADPEERARALLLKARVALALDNINEARMAADEALQLQPEGHLNSETRLVAGEIFFKEADFESAARSFMAVSVLTDDPDLTPLAFKRAAEAYRRSGKNAEADKALKEASERYPGSVVNSGT